MIKLSNISKSFGDKTVLKDFSYTFNKGSRTIIRGASGEGKTTLSRIILGLEQPDSGRVEKDERITALFQEDRLIENLSLMNNLLLVTDDRKRAKELIKEAGLEGNERERVFNLSGGMKRRVALIRTLLTDYDALLLDEPFTGLDDGRKVEISSLIKKELHGRTLIVISHSEEEGALLGAMDEIII